MKKILTSLVVIITFMVYSLMHNKTTTTPALPIVNSVTSSSTVQKGVYKDGTYTGTAETSPYGIVQVQAVVTNGKLNTINLLQYPNAERESLERSNDALPTLTQEAIQAQSSSVDIVSGATDTSDGFMQSLSGALAQAKS